MKTLYVFFLLLFSATMVFSAGNGILEGKVRDRDTGDPLPGANVYFENTKIGAAADIHGYYKIVAPAGEYTLIVSYIEHETERFENVCIVADSTILKNILLEHKEIINEDFDIVVSCQEIGLGETINEKLSSKRLAPPSPLAIARESWIPHNTEEYSKINESGFLDVMQAPLSTFAADVDAASYANIRRFIQQDQLPYKDAVRSEECINYFDYDYPRPSGEHPLAVYLEYSDCPWNTDNRLVHIGIHGKELGPEETLASNLVFLLDVSGSMDEPKKLPLLKKAFGLLVDQLGPQDHVSIVVYASQTGLVLPPTPGNERQTIMKALDKLQAEGSTAGGAGIQLAYKMAKENLIKGGNNRVILATDGDFNVGISSTSELVRYVEEQRDEGIFLTVLGFGMGNYKDDRLQELADRGNGNHAYIDNIMEAKKVLVNDLTATLFTIAKDVKIQVEFNPVYVKSYRLVGYENRELEDKDFEDDTKDAGEIGAGHTVTALYEVVPANPADLTGELKRKYTETTINPDAQNSGEILTVRIRYKQPDGDTSTEMSAALDEFTPSQKTSDNFRFSAAVAQYAMLLRDSEFKGMATVDNTRKLADGAVGKDPFGYRHEFISLLDRLDLLMSDKQNSLE